MYDLCVVGGGMSGMTAAITAARNGKKVILIEKNKKLGKKIYATGNGRCNITNTSIDYARDYNSSYPDYEVFLSKAFGRNPYNKVLHFFESIGIHTMCLDETWVYPASLQASSVVWSMNDALLALGVDILYQNEVDNIRKDDNGFLLTCSTKTIIAKKVILANGSKAYSKLGGGESGYDIAKSLGHSIIPVRPSLCGLVSKEDLSSLSGVRAKAKATLAAEDDNFQRITEIGELQINDYGVSGIMIFNLSSIIGKYLLENKTPVLHIDFLNHINIEQKKEQVLKFTDIIDSIDIAKNRTILGFLNTFVNDKIGAYVCNMYGVDVKTKVCNVDTEIIDKIIYTLSNFKLHIESLKDFDNGQICAGGVDISQINPEDFSSKICDDLYIVGELLDIDGLCGGYNITFAALSALAAGKAI
ncbi:MAG: aminoacetone oxidase family FAD-binding enzyme [Lachnospiraceae bacterium]|nr:aminoacetone oxidase family FAD-binding enzyme [Lachnospiraceae bacterium]